MLSIMYIIKLSRLIKLKYVNGYLNNFIMLFIRKIKILIYFIAVFIGRELYIQS